MKKKKRRKEIHMQQNQKYHLHLHSEQFPCCAHDSSSTLASWMPQLQLLNAQKLCFECTLYLQKQGGKVLISITCLPRVVCAQLCPTLCNPVDCSPSGYTVHGIFQTRVLKWVAISFSEGSSRHRDQTCIFWVSYSGRQILYHCATREAHVLPTFVFSFP